MKKPKNFFKRSKEDQITWVLHKIFHYKKADAKPLAKHYVESVVHTRRHRNIENVDMDVVSYIDANYFHVAGLPDKSYEVLYKYVLKNKERLM